MQRLYSLCEILARTTIERLLNKVESEPWSLDQDDDCSILAWLANVAKDNDRDSDVPAHVEVPLALASVHTTLLRMVNVLYDLSAAPYRLEELR